MRVSAHETWAGNVVRKKVTLSALAVTTVVWQPAVTRKFVISKLFVRHIGASPGSANTITVELGNGPTALAAVAAATVVTKAAELIPVAVVVPPVIIDSTRPLTATLTVPPTFGTELPAENLYDYELIIFAEKVSA